jgi:predicted nucleic acid-binding protein
MRTLPTRTEESSSGINDLPGSVYLDTQFVLAYLVPEDRDHHNALSAVELLRPLADRHSVKAFLSLIVLDELAWKLAGVLYDRDAGARAWRGLSDQQKGEAYRERRAEVAGWLRGLLAEGWVWALSADERVCHALPDIIERHGLRPADACHLACTVRHGVGAIITNDQDFVGLADAPVEVRPYPL